MAGSSQITIEIEEAGLKKIQVTDNGEGIAQDDVALSLHRHATSKIKNQGDLFRIRTLGFRGEALPINSFYQSPNYCDSSGWRSLRD